MMSTSKIKPKTTKADWALEIVALMGVIVTLAYPMLRYNDLPATIPSHYSLTGHPDGHSTKSILFTLPVVMIALYGLLTLMIKFPQFINYPVEITSDNADRQLKNVTLMIRILKTINVLIFLYLTLVTIQSSLGKMQGLGAWFVPLSVLIILGVVVYFIYCSFKMK